jgi:hypothetical protein
MPRPDRPGDGRAGSNLNHQPNRRRFTWRRDSAREAPEETRLQSLSLAASSTATFRGGIAQDLLLTTLRPES